MPNFGRNHDEAFSVPKGINQSVSSPESVPSIHKCMEENGEYSNDSGPGHYNRLQVDSELKQALRKFSEAAQVKGWRERLKVTKPY